MHRTRTDSSILRIALYSGLLAFASCGGGGGGGGGGDVPTGSGPVNSGSFSTADFSYTDPHSVDFQPFGTTEKLLTKRDELMVLNVPEDPANAKATIFDDNAAGSGVLTELAASVGAGQYRTAAAGNLDDDADEELVLVRISGSSLIVHIVERDGGGAFASTSSFTIPSAGFTYDEARVTLADVDGDQRDELLIMARKNESGSSTSDAWLRVYDDPQDGNVLLHEIDWVDELDPFPSGLALKASDLRMMAVELDGDGVDEIALLVQVVESTEAQFQLQVIGDASEGFATLVPWFEVDSVFGGLDGVNVGSRVVAGEFHAGGAQELAVVSFIGGDTSVAKVHSFSFSGTALSAKPVRQIFSSLSSSFGDFQIDRAFDVVAFDRGADGEAELAIAMPQGGIGFGDSVVHVYGWDGVAWIQELQVDAGFYSSGTTATLVATDDDADGQSELFHTTISGSAGSSTKTRWTNRLDWGSVGSVITDTWSASVPASGKPYPAVLVAGDFDADGTSVRFTGNKFQTLADPMPMVVLAAAPTKSGTSQVQSASSTSYVVTSSTALTHGVSSNTAVSTYVGGSISDIFGLFDASARATVELSMTKSQLESQKQSEIVSFQSPYNVDSIVFQGTLYQCYEYEVLSAADVGLVGELFTLDVPVETRTYKWTVDYYNSKVDVDQRIGTDVLSHTIGDPASYPSYGEIDALTSLYVGWKSSNTPPASVGQSGLTNGVAIQLENESTTAEERSFSVTLETGFTVGSVEFGGSFGVTDSSIYSVTVSETTAYQGVVGDIPLPTDYEAWRYDFGIGVYHRGLFSDALNQPASTQPGFVPYQVVTFWTTPIGSAY